jgi:regulator of sigma E protease
MLWLLSILAFLIIFSLLILIHEFGHFYSAKRFGVKVEEFGLGMPPKLWGYKPKNSETIYTINAIPFGGFVRLYGEDSHDAKALKNKRSFASKPVWQRLIIIAAGVLMNFLLAFVLLVIGFTWGMQPLIVNSDDAFAAIKSGVIKLQEGVLVKEEGLNKIGFQAGDRVMAINGKKLVFGDEILSLKDQEKVKFSVLRGQEMVELEGVNQLKNPFAKFYDPLPVPKLVVKDIANDSPLKLEAGQIIDKVNGQLVFGAEDLQMELAAKPDAVIETMPKQLWQSSLSRENTSIDGKFYPVVISIVTPGSNAELAGILEGDEVISINGVAIKSVQDLPVALRAKTVEDKMAYKIRRGGSEVEFFIRKGADGLIGVMLSEVIKLDQYKASFYVKSLPYSVLKIEDVSYPFWQAPGQALQEMGRLSVLTASMFVDVFSSLFTKLSVPDGVAGPVGIAQMTFVFVQEGLMSLIRFTALLSLSLAIINILPFPGLDGGRFFLIIIPALLRKKLNPRLEAIIHLFGFLVLMMLILLVTFNDLAKLFA